MATTMDFVTAMEILGLDINATEMEVREAYRQKAWMCHPDFHSDSVFAKEEMQKLNDAKRIVDAAFKAQKEMEARRKEAQGPEWERQKYTQYTQEKAEDAATTARRARAEAAARAAQAAEAERVAAEELARQEYVKRQAAEQARRMAAQQKAQAEAEAAAEQERIRQSNEAFMREMNEVRAQAQREEKERFQADQERINRQRQKGEARKRESMGPAERAYQEKEDQDRRVTNHLTRLAKLERDAQNTYFAAQSRLVDIEYMVPRPADYRLKVGAQKKILKVTEMRWKAAKKRLNDAEKLAKRGKLDPVAEQNAWDAKGTKIKVKVNVDATAAQENTQAPAQEKVQEKVQEKAQETTAPRDAAPRDKDRDNTASRDAAQPNASQDTAPRVDADASASRPQAAAFVGEEKSVPTQAATVEDQKKKINLKKLVSELKWCLATQDLTAEQSEKINKILKAANKTKALTRVAGAGAAALLAAGLWAYVGVMVDMLDEEIVRMIGCISLLTVASPLYIVAARAERARKVVFNGAAAFFKNRVRG